MERTVAPVGTGSENTSAPVGTVNVFDPHPLNWLFITWNTMEEHRSGPIPTGTS